MFFKILALFLQLIFVLMRFKACGKNRNLQNKKSIFSMFDFFRIQFAIPITNEKIKIFSKMFFFSLFDNF